MKKIKLLAPLLTAATLGSSAVMLTSCNNTKCQIALFVNEGGTLEGGNETFEISKGTKWGDIKNKPTPTPKSGYEFIGWYRGENKITDETVINTSMDIYAWFTLITPAQKYVTVIASPGGKITNGGSTTIVPIDSTGSKWGDVKPSVTADAGYHFTNWYLNNEIIDDNTTLNENSYIYAWFEADDTNKIKIKFNCLEGGTFKDTATTIIECNKNVTWADVKAKTPEPIATTGYKFNGWYKNKNLDPLQDTDTFEETSYVFAYFEKANVTVKIDGKGVEHATITQPTDPLQVSSFCVMREKLDQLVKPENGYELTGWTIDDNRVFDNKIIDSDIVVKPIIETAMHKYQINTSATGVKTAQLDRLISGQQGRVDLMIPSYIFENGEGDPIPVTGIKYYDINQGIDGIYAGNKIIKTLCTPNTMTFLADRSFRNTDLETVYIAPSANRFAYQVFYATSSLTSFNYLGTVAEYKIIAKEGYWCNGMRAKIAICIDGATNI